MFATLELRAMVLQIGDAVCNRFPNAFLTIYVDDDTVEAEGEEQEVEETVTEATIMLCESLTAVGLAISPQKNYCLASSAALGRRIQAKLARWAVKYVGVAKMLGVGVAAGTRRNMQATAQRIKKLAGRSENYAKLKRLGMDIARILRTGGVSTMTYGLQVHGVSDYMLLQMRRVAAGLCGSMARGSHHNLELIIADNGRIRALLEGEQVMNWKVEKDGLYFKAGCYTQSNPDKGDDPESYGEVAIRKLFVTHRRS